MARPNRESTNYLIARVHETIVRYDLFAPGDVVVVGVSGGPDSTCLAVVLQELIETWDLTLHLAHINYGMRGEESELDETFVRALAREFALGVSVEHATSDDLANSGYGSFQARARAARYRFFEDVVQQQGARKIATGHTTDDHVETVLMWMLRGAGLTGLGGMPVERHQQIVRPLLGLTRSDILEYLKAKELAFRTDSTNEDPTYLRNRVRHHLIPVLQAYNPQIQRSLAQLAEIVSEDEKILSTMTRQALQDILLPAPNCEGDPICHISRSRFLKLPRGLQRRCMREAVTRIKGHTRRLTFLHIENVIAFVTECSRSSAVFEFAGVTMHCSDPDVIAMTNTNAAAQPKSWEAQQFSVPDEIQVHPLGCRIRAWRERPPLVDIPSAIHGSRVAYDPMVAYFDEDTFGLPLTVRAWQAGDAFCPSGMGGKRKKLQDYFVDTKVPKWMRSRIPLIVAPEGILWIPGYRQDDRFRRRSTTRRTCIVQLMR